jgi:hypothetical protein
MFVSDGVAARSCAFIFKQQEHSTFFYRNIMAHGGGAD